MGAKNNMDQNRGILNRRMREILHLIAQTNQGLDLPIDSPEITWDPNVLEHLGVIHHSFDLKNNKDFLKSNQPLFVIPNDERNPMSFYDTQGMDLDEFEDEMPAEFYYDEEDWEWGGILEDSEVEIEFIDPYPDISPWGEETKHGREASSHTIPFLPPGEEGEIVTSSLEDILQIDGMESLAWYSPKGNLTRPWGIYITRYAAAKVAERFFSSMDSRYTAWCLASRLILNHEYFHFLSQYHCDRTYTGYPRTGRYAEYDAFWIASPLLVMEEAAANGYALNRSAFSDEEILLASGFFDSMPEPYNMYPLFEPPWGSRAVVYQQDHREKLPEPIGSKLNITSESLFAPSPKEKVPVYIIDYVPENHIGPKMVIFDRIELSPQVKKRIGKGKVPPGVVKKLKKLIVELRGGKFDRVKHLECMNSKSHFAQKNLPNAWRAIWTQIKGRNGWSVVFLGDHDAYTLYQKTHGL